MQLARNPVILELSRCYLRADLPCNKVTFSAVQREGGVEPRLHGVLPSLCRLLTYGRPSRPWHWARRIPVVGPFCRITAIHRALKASRGSRRPRDERRKEGAREAKKLRRSRFRKAGEAGGKAICPCRREARARETARKIVATGWQVIYIKESCVCRCTWVRCAPKRVHRHVYSVSL